MKKTSLTCRYVNCSSMLGQMAPWKTMTGRHPRCWGQVHGHFGDRHRLTLSHWGSASLEDDDRATPALLVPSAWTFWWPTSPHTHSLRICLLGERCRGDARVVGAKYMDISVTDIASHPVIEDLSQGKLLRQHMTHILRTQYMARMRTGGLRYKKRFGSSKTVRYSKDSLLRRFTWPVRTVSGVQKPFVLQNVRYIEVYFYMFDILRLGIW